jgi:hypothetical protein
MNVYPQYRKLCNEKSFYCIEDESHFTEIQIIGQKVFELKIHAIQFPEKLKIKDMLDCEGPYLKIERIEFEGVRNLV